MPNRRFYQRWKDAFRKSDEIIKERQVILMLAHAETDRKYHSVCRELEEMKKKLTAATIWTDEYTRYEKEVAYLQECLDGWQETLDHIKSWEKELTKNRR